MELFATIKAYDHYIKDTQDALNILPRVVKAYIETLKGFEDTRVKWHKAELEVTTLTKQLSSARKEVDSLQSQVQTARKLIDEERKKTKRAEHDRDFFEGQLDQLRDILQDQRNKLHEDTKEKLTFLSKTHRPSADLLEDRLNTINEFETTGSVMSDLSYTRDEEDLLNSPPEVPTPRKPVQRPPDSDAAPAAAHNGAVKRSRPSHTKARKKRRSSSAVRTCELKGSGGDRVIATTTVRMDRLSQVHATAVIETLPHSGQENKENCYQPSAPPLPPPESGSDCPRTPRGGEDGLIGLNTRPHNFQQKAMLKSEVCNVCSKRIRFSTMGVKCRDCKTVCHMVCKEKAALPCIPNANTPGKAASGTISDYAPLFPPKVPALVVHCINEVEARGLSEVGIYRIPGSDREVKALKEKFLKGKGVPNLSQVQDIHTVCGCLKEFLRSLKDPLTTRQRWFDLAQTLDRADQTERSQRLSQLVSELPHPNRDTLAYLILHLQRISEVAECKMPKSNLSKVFGQTVIGYSCNDPDNVYGETQTAHKIMLELMDLPPEFWEGFIRSPNFGNTPSAAPGFLSPRVRRLKNIRYFETP